MKLLFDENLSFKLCQRLADIFPNSSHVRLARMDRATDREIWEYAKAHGFVLVSMDSDFADLATFYGAPPRVIWLRCGNRPTADIEKLLREHVDNIKAFEFDPDAVCLEIY